MSGIFKDVWEDTFKISLTNQKPKTQQENNQPTKKPQTTEQIKINIDVIND